MDGHSQANTQQQPTTTLIQSGDVVNGTEITIGRRQLIFKSLGTQADLTLSRKIINESLMKVQDKIFAFSQKLDSEEYRQINLDMLELYNSLKNITNTAMFEYDLIALTRAKPTKITTLCKIREATRPLRTGETEDEREYVLCNCCGNAIKNTEKHIEDHKKRAVCRMNKVKVNKVARASKEQHIVADMSHINALVMGEYAEWSNKHNLHWTGNENGFGGYELAIGFKSYLAIRCQAWARRKLVMIKGFPAPPLLGGTPIPTATEL